MRRSDERMGEGVGSQKSEVKGQKGEGWVVVLVALVTLLAMGRLCGMDFTWWDDNETIHHNPLMNPATWGTVKYYWTHAFMGLYVPVTYMVWSGLAAIARVTPDDYGIGLNPWVFHTANVVVHLVNVMVVYAILRGVVRKPWAAGVGAMVFGVHPVQVEAVGWVSGMKDLLCGTFVLLAVWQYLIYARGTGAGRSRGGWYWGALVCAGVGTLCKPTAVVTPVLLAVADRWVVGRDWKNVARGVWPFVVVVLPCVVWAKGVQNVGAKAPVWARPLVAGDAVAFYLGKVVWPVGMAVDYGRNPAYVMSTGAVWWTWVIAVGAGAWAWVKGRPAVWGGMLLFVGGMAPVLGFTPFMFQAYSTVADHYLYLPMLGVALVAAWFVARRPRSGWAAGVVIVLLAARSFVQAGFWADDATLDRHTMGVNPRSSVARVNLASALEFQFKQERSPEKREEVIRLLREAIRLNPVSILARENLATVLMQQGEIDEAIRLLLEAIAVADQAPPEEREKLGPSHRVLGMVLAKRGRLGEAVREYRAALEYEPGNKDVEKELLEVEGRLGQK